VTQLSYCHQSSIWTDAVGGVLDEERGFKTVGHLTLPQVMALAVDGRKPLAQQKDHAQCPFHHGVDSLQLCRDVGAVSGKLRVEPSDKGLQTI